MALGIAGVVASLRALAGAPASAQENLPPPPVSDVCPSIEDDGLLCTSDSLGMSGNCTSFVAAADRLASLYVSERQKLPTSPAAALLSTSWWGCGPSSLYDVKRLLTRVGSPAALAVLKKQPYSSLPEVPPPPPPPPPTEPFTCFDLQNPVDRNLCAGAKLQSARAYHDTAFARCKTRVAGPLLDDLLNSEADFEIQTRALCEADTAEAGEGAKSRAYDRAQCLVQAYQQRTNTMITLHPECAPDN